MTHRRAVQQGIVIAYLLVSFAAFVFTMTRIEVPGIPRSLVHFSYGMMAPFQGYLASNQELLAEGKTQSGFWEEIDLQAYLPFLRGERAVRMYLRSFRGQPEETVQAYRLFAEQLLVREPTYGAVRLSWITWPMSPEAYTVLRHEPFITKDLLVIVP